VLNDRSAFQAGCNNKLVRKKKKYMRDGTLPNLDDNDLIRFKRVVERVTNGFIEI
jgi:hypothetical protein